MASGSYTVPSPSLSPLNIFTSRSLTSPLSRPPHLSPLLCHDFLSHLYRLFNYVFISFALTYLFTPPYIPHLLHFYLLLLHHHHLPFWLYHFHLNIFYLLNIGIILSTVTFLFFSIFTLFLLWVDPRKEGEISPKWQLTDKETKHLAEIT